VQKGRHAYGCLKVLKILLWWTVRKPFKLPRTMLIMSIHLFL